MYRVIYKLIHGNFLLSDDMSYEEACDFKDKCLSRGYDTVFIIKIIEWMNYFKEDLRHVRIIVCWIIR